MRIYLSLFISFLFILSPSSQVHASSMQYSVTGIVYEGYDFIDDEGSIIHQFHWDKPLNMTGSITFLETITPGYFNVDQFVLNFGNESVSGNSGHLFAVGNTLDWLYLNASGAWSDWGCSLESETGYEDSKIYGIGFRDHYRFDENFSDITPTRICMLDVELYRSPVPIPTSFLLLSSGLLGLIGYKRKVSS